MDIISTDKDLRYEVYSVPEILGILYEKIPDFLMALLALMRIQAYGSKALQ